MIHKADTKYLETQVKLRALVMLQPQTWAVAILTSLAGIMLGKNPAL